MSEEIKALLSRHEQSMDGLEDDPDINQIMEAIEIIYELEQYFREHGYIVPTDYFHNTRIH